MKTIYVGIEEVNEIFHRPKFITLILLLLQTHKLPGSGLLENKILTRGKVQALDQTHTYFYF